MKLSKTQALELLETREYQLSLAVESDEQTETTRWASIHQLIVKDSEGRFWETTYQRPLTEYQDIEPFEDGTDVDFTEVEKVAVTTYTYREKN